MTKHVVRSADRRRSVTPNGVMTTSASPSLGNTADLSLWWVEMAKEAVGPAHVFDSEQLWSVVEGSAVVEIDGVETELGPGDTVVLPSGAVRRLRALTDVRAVVCGVGSATVSVPGEDGSRGTPPWIS